VYGNQDNIVSITLSKVKEMTANSSTSLYGAVSNATVASNNLTTLYSGSGLNVRLNTGYGNSNVVALLNAGTDGANTVTNIIATGNITANYFIGNFQGNSTNANYANYAGNAFNVSGANVSGYVANATHSNIADVANSVSVANVVGIGNIATVNLDGNVSNVLNGDGVFRPPSGNISANFALYAGNVTIGAQPNITSVGSLANLSVIGNVTSGNANLGNLAIANYFSGDGSLLTNINGGNVSNVANANHANVADTANSVAVANVVGIGNIATVNLDGSSSNVLYGNGQWATISIPSGNGISNGTSNVNIPTSGGNVNTSVGGVANVLVVTTTGANIAGTLSASGNIAGANFVGPLANGTSNVSVLNNAQILFATGGNSNVAIINNGQLTLNPQSNVNNGLVINGYGSNPLSDMWRISSFRYRGTNTAPLSVQPNDATMRFLTAGSNGTALQTNSIASFTARVDSSYTANGANIPLGWQITVNDTNGGINNQSKVHQFFSNGNVSFANSIIVNNELSVSGNANVSGNVTVATGNITATSGVFVGNGAGLTNLTGANVTGTVANATYAVTAGSAGSITGNLANLVVATSNTALPVYQIQPTNTLLVGNTANLSLSPYAYKLTQDYGNGQNDGNLALPGNDSYIKYRGNSATPAAASQNDRIQKSSYYGYNGTANILNVVTDVRVANTNANANAVWGGGIFNIATGNPLGDTGNANALSAYNGYQMDQYGRFIISPAVSPTGITSGSLVVNTYGGSGGAAGMQAVVFNKARGNRDAQLSVQPNDQLGGMTFLAHNGTAYNGTRVGQIRSVVDGSYVANNANIPIKLQFITCSNTTAYATTVGSDGSMGIPGNLSVSGSATTISSGSGSTTVYVNGDKTTNSNFSLYDSQMSVTMNNVDTTTGFSPFRFQQYSPDNNHFGPWYMYRSRGIDYANSAPTVAGDYIFGFNFITNSNNTTVSVGSLDSRMTYNDNAGNYAAAINLNAIGSGSTGVDYGQINLNAANTFVSGNLNASSVGATGGQIGNLQLQQFQETVYSIGSTSGTITPDFNNGSIQTMTLTGSITLNSLANIVAGRSMTLIITQGGSGSYTLTSSMLFAGGSKTLSTTVGAVDIISVFYDGSTYYASLTTGYA
jgi:hypothetical protein